MEAYEQRIANILKIAELRLEQGDSEEADRWIETAEKAMRERRYPA